MARDFTVNNYLIPQVRVLGDFPDDDPRTTDSDILQIANRRLLTDLVPFMQKVRGDYWLKRNTQTLVSDQDRYRIPDRAIGAGLDSLFWQPNNPSGPNTDIYPVNHFSLEDGVSDYSDNLNYITDGTFGYHIEGDEVILSPSPNPNAGSIIMLYNRAPNELVKTGTSDVLVLASVQVSLLTGTVIANANFPDGTYVCDIIQAKPNFDSLVDNISITKSGTSITFATEPPAGVAAGDYLCIVGTSPVPQIPREAQDLLVIATAAEACRNRKDIASAQLLGQDYQVRSESVFNMLSPRVRRQNQKLISRHSPLRLSNSIRKWRY